MSELAFLDSAYKLHLLVEDPRTSIYFKELFVHLTGQIEIIPVGGGDGVKGLVTASWEHASQSLHAVGWCDRDYGMDNCTKWNDDNTHLYRGRAHEIENYLLDWAAMANCDMGFSSYNYSGEAKALAQGMVFNVACSRVLFHLQRRCSVAFPPYPESRLVSDTEVVDYIVNSQWAVSHPVIASKICARRLLEREVNHELKSCNDELANGSWVQTFPGKEIFESLWKSSGVSGIAKRDDYVQSIARYQQKNSVPFELKSFFGILQQRIARGVV